MKRTLLAIAVIAATALFAGAQKADIQIGYGGYTQMDCMDMHDGWGGVNTAWGALTASANFHITRNFAVGPSYSFSSTSTKGHDASHVAYHVIMLNARYTYYRTRIVDLYAHMGVGADISYMQPRHGDNYCKGYFAFQLVPIGAYVSINRNWGLFGELGFGAQGLLQVGARFNI